MEHGDPEEFQYLVTKFAKLDYTTAQLLINCLCTLLSGPWLTHLQTWELDQISLKSVLNAPVLVSYISIIGFNFLLSQVFFVQHPSTAVAKLTPWRGLQPGQKNLDSLPMSLFENNASVLDLYFLASQISLPYVILSPPGLILSTTLGFFYCVPRMCFQNPHLLFVFLLSYIWSLMFLLQCVHLVEVTEIVELLVS